MTESEQRGILSATGPLSPLTITVAVQRSSCKPTLLRFFILAAPINLSVDTAGARRIASGKRVLAKAKAGRAAWSDFHQVESRFQAPSSLKQSASASLCTNEKCRINYFLEHWELWCNLRDGPSKLLWTRSDKTAKRLSIDGKPAKRKPFSGVRTRAPARNECLLSLCSVLWHRSRPKSLPKDRPGLRAQRRGRDQRTHKAGKEQLRWCLAATSSPDRYRRSFYTPLPLRLR